jgi:hypothetical protein
MSRVFSWLESGAAVAAAATVMLFSDLAMAGNAPRPAYGGPARPVLELQLFSGLAAPVEPSEGQGIPWWGGVVGVAGLGRIVPQLALGMVAERSLYAWHLHDQQARTELFAWQMLLFTARVYFRDSAPTDPYLAVGLGQAWPATTADGVHAFWQQSSTAYQFAFGLDWYRSRRLRLGGALVLSAADAPEPGDVQWSTGDRPGLRVGPPEPKPGVSLRFGGTFGALAADVGLGRER